MKNTATYLNEHYIEQMSSFGFVFLEILVVVTILSRFVMTMDTFGTLAVEEIVVVEFLLSELGRELGIEVANSGILQ